VLAQAFGELALQDQAKYLAARFLTDLANVITITITITIDPYFPERIRQLFALGYIRSAAGVPSVSRSTAPWL